MSDASPENPGSPPQPAPPAAPGSPPGYEQLRSRYRESHLDFVQAAHRNPGPDSLLPKANRTAGELAAELQEFCLASGQDLDELNGFLRKLDEEGAFIAYMLEYGPA